ncbi:MAG: hypothetical protein AB7L71_00200 [Vicinamibacterales bacterium]
MKRAPGLRNEASNAQGSGGGVLLRLAVGTTTDERGHRSDAVLEVVLRNQRRVVHAARSRRAEFRDIGLEASDADARIALQREGNDIRQRQTLGRPGDADARRQDDDGLRLR